MARKRVNAKREILPDPKFNDLVIRNMSHWKKRKRKKSNSPYLINNQIFILIILSEISFLEEL